MGKLDWGKVVCGLLLLCVTTAIASPAQTFTALYSFCTQTGCPDGAGPAGLVQATNGDLYGTTFGGGSIGYYGTVFKITPSGTLMTLYDFCQQTGCADGAYPYAGVVQGTNGNLYGTTGGGGLNGCINGPCGTIFKITPSGTLTTLYKFGGTDGYEPYAGLIQATNGNLYGTTEFGGNDYNCDGGGCGTVFKITPNGTLTTLHSFCLQSGCKDGAYPLAGLIQATDGNFYGTASDGGANGYGTVFKITPSGKLTTLHRFDYTDGYSPYAGLIQATDGNFYGTTSQGGTSGYDGTIFKITPSGKLTTLHNFDRTDGAVPYAGLIQATDGNFYGTTSEGGATNQGTIFEITPSGTLTTLYSFCSQTGCTDGAYPSAGLVQDTNGVFYGTTSQGGASGGGTVFSLSVGLGPFVETQPTSGKVGAAVKILGTNLRGATSVTFNGTAAQFTVVSKSEIKTTVPTGATSGPVEVTTPNGTLKSNVVFRVTK